MLCLRTLPTSKHSKLCLISYSSILIKSHSSVAATGSAKLFVDAAKEEEEVENAESAAAVRYKSASLASLESHATGDNWDGEEKPRDLMLRMLVDKYRSNSIFVGEKATADDKLKRNPPTVRPSFAPAQAEADSRLRNSESDPSTTIVPPAPGESWASIPLIPTARQDHRPWHTTYKIPSHHQEYPTTGLVNQAPLPSIKRGEIPSRAGSEEAEAQERKRKRNETKKLENAGRLSRAKEGLLDYKLGIKTDKAGSGSRHINPTNMKGWSNLVEERIERARVSGAFRNISGRGRPLGGDPEAGNPFIERSEFLMNRIVQRHGASPPWVILQQDLTSAITSFRLTLRETWIRRIVRMLATQMRGKSDVALIKVETVRRIRDPEWEAKERGFHEAAIKDINGLVTNYNGMAPYSVRKTYLDRNSELEAMYQDSAEEVVEKLRARTDKATSALSSDFAESVDALGPGNRSSEAVATTRMIDLCKEWMRDVREMYFRR